MKSQGGFIRRPRRSADAIERHRRSTAFEDRLVHRARRHTIASLQVGCTQTVGRADEIRSRSERRTRCAGDSPEKRSSKSIQPGPTVRSNDRRSMRTPRCCKREFAGARSPVRDSSLPAMLSCVIRMARSPSSSARATAIGPPIGSYTATSPSGSRRTRAAHRQRAQPSRSVPPRRSERRRPTPWPE